MSSVEIGQRVRVFLSGLVPHPKAGVVGRPLFNRVSRTSVKDPATGLMRDLIGFTRDVRPRRALKQQGYLVAKEESAFGTVVSVANKTFKVRLDNGDVLELRHWGGARGLEKWLPIGGAGGKA